MYPDIDAVTKLLKEDKIWLSVKHHIEEYNNLQVCFLILIPSPTR